MIIIKSADELSKIRRACEIWKKARAVLTKSIHPGVSLNHLDAIAGDTIVHYGGKPAFKGYLGFPKNICISRNRVIIHGIPDDSRVSAGDKLTFDMGVECDGYYCDAAFTYLVPPVSGPMQQLNEVTHQALMVGINAISVANHVGAIGAAVSAFVATFPNYHFLPDFSGHGCGKHIHEDPPVYNVDSATHGPLIKPGMVLCIEPMIMTKSNEYVYTFPQWNVRAKNDDSLVCHWEHMVAVDYDGKVVVLTD